MGATVSSIEGGQAGDGAHWSQVKEVSIRVTAIFAAIYGPSCCSGSKLRFHHVLTHAEKLAAQ
jgi:hypothetical protein